ncbi:MAG: deoxyribose-phosphate aldolase [Desulfofustis sp.]|nr:deoxyribose-phosphate aldolase [Desulfofustis sp.]NNF45778.1 deoxyribose-phosphate aldolase [Desulfofustis sp.]RZW22693.1 MAG: deoxyribose-phosphate aldolase [Desulfobulbaceae bacterium]
MDEAINRYLDAAVLYPELERNKAQAAIQSIIDYNCRTACIRPCDIGPAVELCRDTATDVCVVLGFPHGCGLSRVKTLEAQAYLDEGVDEIDMVVNYGYIRSGLWELVEEDIRAVSEVTRERSNLLKVILETSELSAGQIARATECAVAAKADYVKTSTGFAGGGATVEAVRAMLEAADGRIAVKASGGIRDFTQARSYIDMGVSRLGVGYPALATICSGAPGTDADDY